MAKSLSEDLRIRLIAAVDERGSEKQSRDRSISSGCIGAAAMPRRCPAWTLRSREARSDI
jgi:hypothetical protein